MKNSSPRGPLADPHPFFRDTAWPRIFAHRGFVPPGREADGLLDNTREAFAAALAAGTELIESDCLLTKDGHVALVHDDDLMTPFGDPRSISEVTVKELREMFEGRGGFLTLEEALTEFPQARLNIDMKEPAVAIPAGRIIGRLAPERTLIASFNDRSRKQALDVATTLSGGVRPATSAGQHAMVGIVAALATGVQRVIERAFAGLDAVQVPEKFGPVAVLTPRLIAAAHRCGVEVHVWTVNDPRRMRELVDLGVDGIVTDRTDLAAQVLR